MLTTRLDGVSCFVLQYFVIDNCDDISSSHWKPEVVMMPTLLSLMVPEFCGYTYDAASNVRVGIMITFDFYPTVLRPEGYCRCSGLSVRLPNNMPGHTFQSTGWKERQYLLCFSQCVNVSISNRMEILKWLSQDSSGFFIFKYMVKVIFQPDVWFEFQLFDFSNTGCRLLYRLLIRKPLL